MRVSLSASSVLFHMTTIQNASKVLADNAFELTAAAGVVAEEAILTNSDRFADAKDRLTQRQVGRMFYLSMSRSTTGAFSRNNARDMMVIFKLDGEKLAQRYKIAPVDYWGSLDLGSVSMRDKRNEQEDRLYTGKPSIPAVRYITEVHVCAPNGENAIGSRSLYDIRKQCLIRKIPLFVYDNKQDFLLRDKRKTKKVAFTSIPEASAYRGRKRRPVLAAYLELFRTPVALRSKLSKDAESAIRHFHYNEAGPFKADLHNARSAKKGDATPDREVSIKLIGILQNLKLTPDGFFKYLTQKWTLNNPPREIMGIAVSSTVMEGQELVVWKQRALELGLAAWPTIHSVGWMQHWKAHRPPANVTPSVIDAEISELHVMGSLLSNGKLFFKGLSDRDFAHPSTHDPIVHEQKGPDGYYSTDVFRALTFIKGRGAPVKVGDKGWLLICIQPAGVREIDPSMGLRKPDGTRAFNNDFIFGSARVIGIARVTATRILPRG